MDERLKKQMTFLEEIDKEKEVGRQTYLASAVRKENDAEHAWHMAIMAYLLAEHSNQDIDVLHTMIMLLIHDIVEIDAGDTYAYDSEGKKTQAEREMKAAKRLYSMLPEDQAKELMDIWLEFEARETAEAKFARTLDNLQPTMLNNASGGKSWKEKGVHFSQIMNRNACTKDGSKALWEYELENFLKPNIDKGNIIDDIND